MMAIEIYGWQIEQTGMKDEWKYSLGEGGEDESESEGDSGSDIEGW